jgi:hypothetical protein
MKFKTDVPELPATDAINGCLCCTNSFRLKHFDNQIPKNNTLGDGLDLIQIFMLTKGLFQLRLKQVHHVLANIYSLYRIFCSLPNKIPLLVYCVMDIL